MESDPAPARLVARGEEIVDTSETIIEVPSAGIRMTPGPPGTVIMHLKRVRVEGLPPNMPPEMEKVLGWRCEDVPGVLISGGNAEIATTVDANCDLVIVEPPTEAK